MRHSFCWNCYNFEDRRDIDGVVLCAKGHAPRTPCEDFVEREEPVKIGSNSRLCLNCRNFEDRRETDEALLCARGHCPEGSCEDFINKGRKLGNIANNNRYERVTVRGILMSNTNALLQNLKMKWGNSRKDKFTNFDQDETVASSPGEASS